MVRGSVGPTDNAVPDDFNDLLFERVQTPDPALRKPVQRPTL